MGKALAKSIFFMVFFPLIILELIAFLPFDIVVMVYKTIKSKKGIQFMLGYAEGYWEGTIKRIGEFVDYLANA
jgi:hypothetical protein